jgi:hypothetical protein
VTGAAEGPALRAPGLRRPSARPVKGLWRLIDRVELQCRGCGYGAVVRGDPPPCPMCRGNDWGPPRRPRLRLAERVPALR